jgi:WD40 repeat protein
MPEPNVPSGSVENAAGAPPDIPGHRLLRRIGQGSYGEVWLAQANNGDYHAVKIVFRRTFERDRPFEREFSGIQKFEPVSRAHPSQVSILQVGRSEEAGFFYYVMELADDSTSGRQIDPEKYKPKTLRSEVAAARRIPYDRALDISLSLTKALEHLHRHGLIHRDIKPSNIIFVNGVPKLADIGLVTDVGASISYVGTEGFLPPEGPVSQQADLYSLGKVLYEMSTGQDRLDFPELPTFLGDAGEKEGLLELNLVFLKACQNDPRKRYRTAQEMSADLAILRSGKSLKRARALERRLMNVTRAFVLTALIGLLGAGGYYAWNRHRVNKLRADMAAQSSVRQAAQEAEQEMKRRLLNGYLASGEQAGREGDRSGALAWFTKALSEESDAARAAEHKSRVARTLQGFPRLAGFMAHAGGLNSALFSRDASRVTTAGEDSTVKIWNTTSGQQIGKPLRHKSPVRYAELSGDGLRLLSICKDGTAWLWRMDGADPVAFEIEHGAAVVAGEFSPDGRFALTRGENNTVIVSDGLSARSRFKLGHDEAPVQARYSPDGRHIGVASGKKLTFWGTERGEKLAEATSAHGKLLRFAFSPDSRRVVAVAGTMAQLCNVADGEWSVFSIQEPSNIIAAEFTPDNRRLITGTEDGTIRTWDAVTGQPGDPPKQFGMRHTTLTLSGDGSAAALAGENHGWLVDLRSYGLMMPPTPYQRGVRSCAFSPDARLILTAGLDGGVWLTELFSGSTNAPFLQADFGNEQLLALARLLSGREVSKDERLIEVSSARLLADWERLRTNAAFQPTPPDRWHTARAERLFNDGLWFGVRFHIERVRKLGVADERLQEWDAKAAQELALLNAPARPVNPVPARSAEAKANLIDLGPFYNASLTEAWLPGDSVGKSNDLSQLPAGVQKFNGVVFDVRGLVQLSGSTLENLGAKYPKQITDIPIHRRATNLHFLHGAAWGALYGTVIGKYVVHYENGEMREAKIVFGRNVREWWFAPTQPQIITEGAVAWQGDNPASRQMGMALRIYQYRWRNPLPDELIAKIDFISTMEKPGPFLMAITADPAD